MATVKFLFDEHINPILAQGLFLKDPTILVTQAHQHFAGRSDEDHLAWAAEFGFIFVNPWRSVANHLPSPRTPCSAGGST
jgi:hypothetical protein